MSTVVNTQYLNYFYVLPEIKKVSGLKYTHHIVGNSHKRPITNSWYKHLSEYDLISVCTSDGREFWGEVTFSILYRQYTQ